MSRLLVPRSALIHLDRTYQHTSRLLVVAIRQGPLIRCDTSRRKPLCQLLGHLINGTMRSIYALLTTFALGVVATEPAPVALTGSDWLVSADQVLYRPHRLFANLESQAGSRR